MFTYNATIRRDFDLLDSKEGQSLADLKDWAENQAIRNDFIVITEQYMGVDGTISSYNHIESYKIDFPLAY